MERVLVSTGDGVPDLDKLDQRVGALGVEGVRGLDKLDRRSIRRRRILRNKKRDTGWGVEIPWWYIGCP